MEATKLRKGEYYSINRNISDVKILALDSYKPEFIFLGKEIYRDVQTEIICEDSIIGFDCQILYKNGNNLIFRNITCVHWGIDGKLQFSLESNFIQEQNIYPFKSVKRLEIIQSPELYPFITSKLNN